MNTTLELAEALAEELEAKIAGTDPFTVDATVEVQARPHIDVRDGDGVRLLVIPSSQSFEGLTRARVKWQPVVDVGVIARCDRQDIEAIWPLLSLVNEVAAFVVGLEPEGFRTGVATSVPENDPLYSPERLDKDLFLSVLRVPFLATIARG